MMSETVDYNLNVRVEVRLTPEGIKFHRKYYRDLAKRLGMSPRRINRLPPADRYGWRKFMLWELMQIFGSGLRMGAGPVFFEKNDVRLPKNPMT